MSPVTHILLFDYVNVFKCVFNGGEEGYVFEAWAVDWQREDRNGWVNRDIDRGTEKHGGTERKRDRGRGVGKIEERSEGGR